MKTWKIGIVIAVGAVSSGCDLLGGTAVVDTVQARSLDGIKLIALGHEEGDEASGFNQGRYDIDASHRVLVRYEALLENQKDVRAGDGYKVELTVYPTDRSQLDAAAQALRLCPLQQNWMMAATWTRAHPFGRAGRWAQPGGAYLASECLTGVATEHTHLLFDITPWFLAYVRGRNQNFGLVLVADQTPVSIEGDANGYSAPQILWKTTQYYPGPTPTPSPFPTPSPTASLTH
jgi:hypothetical protein